MWKKNIKITIFGLLRMAGHYRSGFVFTSHKTILKNEQNFGFLAIDIFKFLKYDF